MDVFATAWVAATGMQILCYRWDPPDAQPCVFQLGKGLHGQVGATLGFDTPEAADRYWQALRQPQAPERKHVEAALVRAYARL